MESSCYSCLNLDKDAILLKGFDDCIIGTVRSVDGCDVAAYSTGKIIKKLVERDGMDYQEASDFFEFNIVSAYMGKGMPVFIETSFHRLAPRRHLPLGG